MSEFVIKHRVWVCAILLHNSCMLPHSSCNPNVLRLSLQHASKDLQALAITHSGVSDMLCSHAVYKFRLNLSLNMLH